MGPEIVNDAQEIKIRSEIKAGEFLKTMEKQNGRPSSKRLQGVTLLSEMGIQRIQSHRWQKKPPLHYFTFLMWRSHKGSVMQGRFVKNSLVLSTNFKKACIMHPGVKTPVAGRNHR